MQGAGERGMEAAGCVRGRGGRREKGPNWIGFCLSHYRVCQVGPAFEVAAALNIGGQRGVRTKKHVPLEAIFLSAPLFGQWGPTQRPWLRWMLVPARTQEMGVEKDHVELTTSKTHNSNRMRESTTTGSPSS